MAAIHLTPAQKAILEIGRHLVVRANAGSGKTFALTLRIIWLVVEHGVDLRSIVAITFTTKAAAEMRDRVRRLTTHLLNDHEARSSLTFTVPDSEVIRRLQQLQRDVGTARISTFHAFAAGILRSYGADHGFDPDARDITERQQATLIRNAVRTAIRAHMNTTMLVECHEFLGIETTERLITQLVTMPEQTDNVLALLKKAQDGLTDYRLQAIPVAVSQGLMRTVNNALSELTHIIQANSNEWPSRLATLQKAADDFSEHMSSREKAHAVVCALDEFYTQKGTLRSKVGAASDAQPLPMWSKVRVAFASDREAEALQASLLHNIITIVQDATAHYNQRKRAESVVDFNDMIQGAVDVLQQVPGAAISVRSGLSYLMVDEFQDTNPLQYKLLQLLIPDLNAKADRGAELLVVGDDKQSIYGFRDADVRLFRTVELAAANANRRQGVPSDSLSLVHSFRMLPELADQINRVCESVFSNESDYDVDYEPLISARESIGAASTGTLRARLLTASSTADSDDSLDSSPGEMETSSSEFAEIVARVLDILTGHDPILVHRKNNDHIRLEPPKPEDIGILLRKRNDVTELARLLQTKGVPVHVHGGRAFYSRPEVADVRNLLIVLADPHHRLALMSVLRSPIFRCTDDDLVLLASAKNGTSMLQDTQADDIIGESERLTHARQTLQYARSLLGSVPIATIVRKVLKISGWYRTMQADPRTEQAIKNIDKLIDIIRSEEEQDGISLSRIIDAISVPETADNESEHDLDTSNAVQIMTLHAAKGLEFPIVILGGISSSSNNATIEISDELGPTFSIAKKVFPPNSASLPVSLGLGGSHLLNSINKTYKDRAEQRRLLYVALTRAEDHAIVIIQGSTRKDGGISFRSAMAEMLYGALPLMSALPDRSQDTATVEIVVQPRPKLSRLSTIETASAPAWVHVSALVHTDQDQTKSGSTATAEYGTWVHDQIAQILADRTVQPVVADPILQRFIEAMPAWEQIPPHAHMEQEWVSVLNNTLVIGRPDVYYLTNDPAVMHLWDWKVIEAPSPEERERVFRRYRPQLLAYSWLLLQHHPAVQTIQVNLAFVPHASPRTDEWIVAETFQRIQSNYLETEVRSAIARAAAAAEDHAH